MIRRAGNDNLRYILTVEFDGGYKSAILKAPTIIAMMSAGRCTRLNCTSDLHKDLRVIDHIYRLIFRCVRIGGGVHISRALIALRACLNR